MKLAENALTGSLLTADNKNTASVVVLIQHCLFRGISCGQQGPHKFAAKAGPRYSHHMPIWYRPRQEGPEAPQEQIVAVVET